MFAGNPLNEEELLVPQFGENSFRFLDFCKADFDNAREKLELEDIEWSSTRNKCSFDEFPQLFADILLQVCRPCLLKRKFSS
jgi:hypothetical protein